jgi:uncharacterized protein YodC (DUF2158 family)
MSRNRVEPIITPEGAEEIRKGSIVQLKSGGMRMVVRKVAPDAIDCEWHVPSGDVKAYTFDPEQLLVLVPQAEPEPKPAP